MFSLHVVVIVHLVMISAALSTPSLVTDGREEETHADNQDKVHLAYGQKRSIEAQQPVKELQNKPQVKPKQQPKNPATVMIPVRLPPDTRKIDQGSYITIFDTRNNIPFYSAYVITPEEAANIGTIQGAGEWVEDIDELTFATAVYEFNYKDEEGNILLQKGQMNPSLLNSFDKSRMEATFRLSNAAPQYKTSGGGPWKRYEELLAAYAKEVCARELKGTLYVYTGTALTFVEGQKEPDERVPHSMKRSRSKDDYSQFTIPASMFTAACCVNAGGVQASMAVMTNNHYYLSDLHQTEMTVQQLYENLGGFQGVMEFFMNDPLKQCNSKEKGITLSKVAELQKLVAEQKLAARIRYPATVMIPARLPPDTRPVNQGLGKYITLFDTKNNIPFYSAYVIYPEEALKIGTVQRQGRWKEDIDELKDANAVYDHNRDMDGKGHILERGHMNPSYINTFLQARSDLTFHLSNAAPQYKTSNGGPWNRYEGLLADYAKKVCATKHGGTLYVYTGRGLVYVPGQDEPQERATQIITKPPLIPKPPSPELIKMLQVLHKAGKQAAAPKRIDYPRILIPTSIYTAACCVNADGVQASMAVMTNNHWNEPDLHQTEMSVPELYEALGGSNGATRFFMKDPLRKCNTKFKATILSKL